MAEKQQDVAVRKRQQIAKANQMMFVWVVIASAIVGAAAMVSYSLSQRLLFNEKILSEKGKTISVLNHNNSIADQLKENVGVLNTNEALKALKTPADTEPAQVVLDALPAKANSTALGASLQSKDLLGLPGVTIESLTVDPVAGEETSTGETAASDTTTATTDAGTSAIPVTFSFSVSVDKGQKDKLKDVLKQLERSIRATTLTSLKIELQGNRVIMTGSGNAYYLPAVSVKLTEKTVKP